MQSSVRQVLRPRVFGVGRRYNTNSSLRTAHRPPPPSTAIPMPGSYFATSSRRTALSLVVVFGSATLGYILSQALEGKVPLLGKKNLLIPDVPGGQSGTVAAGYLPPADSKGPYTNNPKYGSKADYEAAIVALKEQFRVREDPVAGEKAADGNAGNEVGLVEVSTDEGDLESHGFSEWSYHEPSLPTVVVFVHSTADVQQVVKIANQYKIPITPYSGGTSLEGHVSSPYGGISLDLSGMDNIIRISEKDGDCTVQAGVGWEDLNAELVKRGIPLFFPLDPGPGARIAGMIGTGCSGTNAVRYGTAKAEWILNVTVVLPSGEVIKTRQRARKSSAGWDTTKLFIGAEGTLGIVTEATLRLAPKLPTKVAIITFDSGVEAAVNASTEMVTSGLPIQCVEFLDALTMKAIDDGGLTGRNFKHIDTLFLKLQGSDASMTEVAKRIQEISKKHGGRNFEFAKTDKESEGIWAGRKAALWSVMALEEGAKVWTTDVCVPISAIARMISETTQDFADRGITACHFGHVGDGNVHTLALFKNDEELANVREAVHEMVERAIDLDGTCTGEHGVGLGKVEYLERELGKGTVTLMETVKRTLDPHGLMNPGKLYPNRGKGWSTGVRGHGHAC